MSNGAPTDPIEPEFFMTKAAEEIKPGKPVYLNKAGEACAWKGASFGTAKCIGCGCPFYSFYSAMFHWCPINN